ncbi:replication endonuclease [Serratia marcescens]|uniref:replication endonuclease n=1 Tax=Serratia marcescens TaxID=615 RepID=UPI00404665EE
MQIAANPQPCFRFEGGVAAPWPHPWNSPRPAIEPPPGLVRKDERVRLLLAEKLAHAQATLNRQPGFVQRRIREKMDWIEKSTKTKSEGIRRANVFLVETFIKRTLPRLDKVNDRMAVSDQALDTAVLAKAFNGLPANSNNAIKTLARAISDFITAETNMLPGDDMETVSSDDPLLSRQEGARQVLDAYSRAAALTQRFRRRPPGQANFNKAADLDINAENFNTLLDQVFADILRMCAEKWWLNQLTNHAKRWSEGLLVALGEVSKKKGKAAYASHNARCNHREQIRRNHEFVKDRELEDENGERTPLIDKVYASVANPTIRRHELMVRTRGYEEVADRLGYESLFLTLTAPSKYHATTRHGYHNHKWCGALPNETQLYFTSLWEKIRAKLGRKALGYFGTRVTEAHHDGTPHWHMLLFVRQEDRDAIVSIFNDYALREDPGELISARARKARFHCEVIDKTKGSATGYIAKYISKNIDGYALDGLLDDETGRPMQESAAAIGAWASLWGIRQFQFLGSVPVSPWRELRKLDDHDTALGLSVECAAVHDAANKPDWADYVMAQGGPFVKRADLTVRPWYERREQSNDYGEAVKRIRGIYMPEIGEDCPIITHIKEYKIVPKKRADDEEAKVSGLAVDRQGASAPPRSSVNNCTESQKFNNSAPDSSDITPPEISPPATFSKDNNDDVGHDFDRMTPRARRALLQRLRTTTPAKVENPLRQMVLALSTPLEAADWPQVKANTSPEKMTLLRAMGVTTSTGDLEAAWARRVAAEREAAARTYHKVAEQWEMLQRGVVRQETSGEAMLARELTPLEYQLGGFASSIGLSLTETQLKALTAGATLSVDGRRYRARADGNLYLCASPAKKPAPQARFERLCVRVTGSSAGLERARLLTVDETKQKKARERLMLELRSLDVEPTDALIDALESRRRIRIGDKLFTAGSGGALNDNVVMGEKGNDQKIY